MDLFFWDFCLNFCFVVRRLCCNSCACFGSPAWEQNEGSAHFCDNIHSARPHVCSDKFCPVHGSYLLRGSAPLVHVDFLLLSLFLRQGNDNVCFE